MTAVVISGELARLEQEMLQHKYERVITRGRGFDWSRYEPPTRS